MERICIVKNNMIDDVNMFLSEHPGSCVKSVTPVSDGIVYIVVNYKIENMENEGSSSAIAWRF